MRPEAHDLFEALGSIIPYAAPTVTGHETTIKWMYLNTFLDKSRKANAKYKLLSWIWLLDVSKKIADLWSVMDNSSVIETWAEMLPSWGTKNYSDIINETPK